MGVFAHLEDDVYRIKHIIAMTKSYTSHDGLYAAAATCNPLGWRRVAALMTLVMTFAWAGAQTPATLANGVYTISNEYNDRGTMCYGTIKGNNYSYGLTDIGLGGYTGNSLTVKNNEIKNEYWYVYTTELGTYIYNIGEGTFLQPYATEEAAAYGATCNGGFTLESRTIDNTAYTIVKSDTRYLSFCCSFAPADGQIRWLSAYEAAAQALTFTAVANGNTTYADEIATAQGAIGEYEKMCPVISIAGWEVTLKVPDGATAYYTTDGTVPSSASTEYTGAFSHGGATAIKAIAVKDGVASGVVTFSAKSAVPTYTFNDDNTQVTFAAGADVTYYYTTNGDEPSSASQHIAGGNSRGFSVDGVIKVRELEEGKLASDVVTVQTLGVAPQVSGDTQTYTYRIVNTRRHVFYADTRYLYPLGEQGTYGRWLKIKTEGDVSATSEQYWYLVDAGDGYCYIVSRQTGEYLYYNTVEVDGQKRFEMSPSHRTRFKIVPSLYAEGNIVCRSYNIVPADNQGVSFNPYGGESGFIASYDKTDDGSHWYFADEVEVTRMETPEIALEGQNVVMSQAAGATIYYSTDGTRPTEETGTEYTGEFAHEPFAAGDRILAAVIAPEVAEVPEGGVIVDTGNEADASESLATGRRSSARSGSIVYNSAVAIKVLEATPAPFVIVDDALTRVTITNGADDAVLYYSIDGTTPTYGSDVAEGIVKLAYDDCAGKTVKVYALQEGYLRSEIVEAAMKYIAVGANFDFSTFDPAGSYYLTEDITLSSTIAPTFTGTLDGRHHTISGLAAPLFGTADGATIKNVVLENVAISGGSGNVGAIVGTASGTTRIYNCGVLGGSIGGGDNVGGIAGRLDDEARVINCYSYADITGGTTVGGIVGYNSVASTASNLKTLVMNCMFYGNITGGNNISPVYNGRIISNAGATGINNYNYYRYESPYSVNGDIDTYNCALAAEERYLTRFEFYRGILNSQRKLCAFYVEGNVDAYEEIDKWVVDKAVAPYPIIKPWGKYPSTINKVPTDPDKAYRGKVLGTLAVDIVGHGTEALPITDMDTLNYDYNYYKVQLPYYNDYFDDNYTNGRVVTGWKITAVTGGEEGTFTTSGDDRYNFADRHCTSKDLYGVTGIVFAQGGYYNVPEGVTGITIEPYWGKAVFLSDAYYDKVYSTGYTGSDFTISGETPDSYNGQQVYKSLASALAQLDADATTVYDNAIVLVGNYHSLSDNWSDSQKRPFTIMSVDENRDNEPDYCVFHGHSTARVTVNPVRFDFLWHPGLGRAHKVTGSGARMPNQSIFRPLGWFEITETCLARYTEFEYDYANGGRTASPMILNNGVFEQFMSLFNDADSQNSSRTTYLKLGGNVYMEAFSPGTHTTYAHSTQHPPVTVCGGEYKEFYLSGVRPDASTVESDALCYSNGGMFSLFAGAYMEKIDGDVVVKMDHSRVREFYGGGVNSVQAQISGDIRVTVNNCLIDFYCGGPKFGSMAEGKIVTTEAVGTQFGKFYGAGYGGTSFYIENVLNATPNSTVFNGGSYSGLYTAFNNTANGYATNYHFEHFSYAGGTGTSLVNRFYNHYASLTFAQTHDVVSMLDNCIVNEDFYGGGNQGRVNGSITSMLIDCRVGGSAYGGGYSAATPTCEVRRTLPSDYSALNTNTGIFGGVTLPLVEEYKWANGITEVDHTRKLIPTDLDLKDLGLVAGEVKMVIGGDSKIGNSVFGGGNESTVEGQTEVIIEGAGVVINESVFGGGNEALVDGDTHVRIKNGIVNGNVYGAGNKAEVTGTTDVVIGGGE